MQIRFAEFWVGATFAIYEQSQTEISGLQMGVFLYLFRFLLLEISEGRRQTRLDSNWINSMFKLETAFKCDQCRAAVDVEGRWHSCTPCAWNLLVTRRKALKWDVQKNNLQKVAKHNEQKVSNHTVKSKYKYKERSVSKCTEQTWTSTRKYWNLRNAKNKICKNTDDAHSEAYEHTAYVLAAERKFLNS